MKNQSLRLMEDLVQYEGRCIHWECEDCPLYHKCLKPQLQAIAVTNKERLMMAIDWLAEEIILNGSCET